MIIKTANCKQWIAFFKVSIFKENEERFKSQKTVVLHQRQDINKGKNCRSEFEQREVDFQCKCTIWGREAKMYRLVQIQSF